MQETGESGAQLLPLTYGVELEYLFVVDKKRVVSDRKYHFLLPKHFVLDKDDQVGNASHFDPQGGEHRGLCQAAMLLRRSHVDLAMKLFPKNDDSIFSRWSLTTESAVVHPDGSKEKAALAAQMNVTPGTLKQCELTGVELVSPILPAPDMRAQRYLSGGSFDELDHVLRATNQKGIPCTFIAGPKTTSVHVHVGLQPDQNEVPRDIPIDVCQHLAWLIVVFEDVITLLHHPERHAYVGTKSYSMCKSSRHAMGDIIGHTCDKVPVFDPWKAFDTIFRAESHLELCKVMGNEPGWGTRYTTVNFSHIASSAAYGEEIKTIEFRQHCGTGDATEIKELVYFVSCLFRTAERKANESIASDLYEQGGFLVAWPDIEMAKYDNIFSNPKRTMRELFDLMELPIGRREYWYERAKFFRSEKFAHYYAGNTCHPECTGTMRRDAEGWAEGEVIERPWGPPSPPTSPITDASSWSETSIMTPSSDGQEC